MENARFKSERHAASWKINKGSKSRAGCFAAIAAVAIGNTDGSAACDKFYSAALATAMMNNIGAARHSSPSCFIYWVFISWARMKAGRSLNLST